MDNRLIGAIKSAEGDLARRRRKAEEDGEDNQYWDVSHAYDDEFQGEEVSNPFKGLSQVPDAMIPLQRPHMEQRLRVCIDQANRQYWGSLVTSDGIGQVPINPFKLRQPTKAEAKDLRFTPNAQLWAREAAHIRAYLAQLDAKAEAEEKAARERRRSYLRDRARRDKETEARLLKTIEDNKVAAARHEQRLKDEEAFTISLAAHNDIAALKQRASVERRELETLS